MTSLTIVPEPIEPVPPVLRLGDLRGALLADTERRHHAHATGTALGPVTGFTKLDRQLGGSLAPGVHVLHANTGTGKTAFALQIASCCGYPALYLTAEMAPLELLRREVARETGTYLSKLKSGEMPAAEMEALLTRTASLDRITMIDATRYPATPAWLTEIVAERKPGLLVIDSLHSWSVGWRDSRTSEYDSLGVAMDELKRIAQTHGIPVLVISERSRGAMVAGGVNAGAGNRSIEYGAESVIELDRKKDAMASVAGDYPVTVALSKNRHGSAYPQGWSFLFNGGLMRFMEI